MPANAAKQPSEKPVVDLVTNTITFNRTFAATPDKVFAAWTTPAHISQWWDASGQPLKDCKIDLRVGGTFTFVNAGPAGAHPFTGVYREITPPSRLVFDALGSLGTVEISPAGANTKMTVTIRCSSAEHLNRFIKMGVDAGTAQTLDNLGEFLR